MLAVCLKQKQTSRNGCSTRWRYAGGVAANLGADELRSCKERTGLLRHTSPYKHQAWRQQGKRGIWLRIPIEKAAYLEPAVAAGFEFHHAERNYVMCTRWLADLDENKLPANASHQVRCTWFAELWCATASLSGVLRV